MEKEFAGITGINGYIRKMIDGSWLMLNKSLNDSRKCR
jgi:hypothetical protein